MGAPNGKKHPARSEKHPKCGILIHFSLFASHQYVSSLEITPKPYAKAVSPASPAGHD
jgi:hypothetical protein